MATISCFVRDRLFAPAAAALSLLALFGTAPSAATPASAPRPVAGMVVSTIAGSGLPNVRDGSALTAGLLFPGGLVYDKAGALYVADVTGQRIRRLRGGMLDTVAGGGTIARNGSVPGDYRDGSPATARFNQPLGLAIDGAGAVYVADSGNHVIRRIASGAVTTFAGRAADGSGVDGAAATASLAVPTSLSFSADGDLYVADAGIGLRRIARDGQIGTLVKAPHISGVSAFGNGDTTVVFWSDSQSLHRLIPATGKDEVIGTEHDSRWEGMTPTRYPYQLVALSADEVAFTDIISNSVRYYRRALPPFSNSLLVRSLIGRDGADLQNSGGFRDGPARDALANAPMSVVRAPDGSIVFSDGGNGRIRRISGFSSRNFVHPDLSGMPDASDGAYHIVYISASYAFYDTLWPESIGGVIENRLNQDAAKIGLKRRVHVDVVRLDGSPIAAQLDFATRVLADSAVNAIVLGVNDSSVDAVDAASKPIAIPAPDQIQKALRETDATLRGRGVFFCAVVHPSALETAPWERLYHRWTNDLKDPAIDLDTLVRVNRVVTGSGVRTYDASAVFIANDKLPQRTPLFASADHHLSIAGNALLGNYIADELERARPWAVHP